MNEELTTMKDLGISRVSESPAPSSLTVVAELYESPKVQGGMFRHVLQSSAWCLGLITNRVRFHMLAISKFFSGATVQTSNGVATAPVQAAPAPAPETKKEPFGGKRHNLTAEERSKGGKKSAAKRSKKWVTKLSPEQQAANEAATGSKWFTSKVHAKFKYLNHLPTDSVEGLQRISVPSLRYVFQLSRQLPGLTMIPQEGGTFAVSLVHRETGLLLVLVCAPNEVVLASAVKSVSDLPASVMADLDLVAPSTLGL